ncbi:MAG: AAA family ATPase, partial [Actinobacteria bacterium]|nr:AAA family ATPase [Actinomycetota bacterium]
MHLSAINLRGFKSFPDPLEIRLERGVAVVVGPNGSGKSNIADAIVWAAGSLAPSELRAEKPDDVLFTGSPGRPPADWCEVELLFDNRDGAIDLPYSEVSLVRRLHRGGEGQYLINHSPVRRLDLVELLADFGLGDGMHSIVGQGRVEAILASRPEERRAALEEAAGLGRFKHRRHRAELKLARVAVEVDRARDLEDEVRKRLRPLALQATAADRAERLGGEIATLEATLASLELAALEERLAASEERRAAATLERKRLDRQLQSVLGERDAAEEELADQAGRREAATAALYRLRSAGERLDLRREAADDLEQRMRGELVEAEGLRAAHGPSWEERERVAKEADNEARRLAVDSSTLSDEVRLARERLAALDRSLVEQEGLPPAARALSEAGHPLALTLLEVEPGYERAVASVLAWRAAALVAPDPAAAFGLAERARSGGLGNVGVLLPGDHPGEPASAPPLPGAERLVSHVRVRPGGEPVARALVDAWVVDSEHLLEGRRGVFVTREGHCFVPASGELWYAGEAAEAVLLELRARRHSLAEEVEELATRAAACSVAAGEAEEVASRALSALGAAGLRRPRRTTSPTALRSLLNGAERLASMLAGVAQTVAEFEPPLRARVDAGSLRAGGLAAELRRLGAAEAELRRTGVEASQQAAAIEVEIARLEAEAGATRRRLAEAGAEPVPSVETSNDELAEKLDRLTRRREALGRVNPFAKEEYEREKERLDELSTQRDDLERSLA